MVEKPEIRISVRNLVEFLLRSGDIDMTVSGGSNAMLQEGSRIHRKLQNEAAENYQAEVRLSCETQFPEFVLVVDGIADGVIEEQNSITIDEIKSVSTPLDMVDENYNPLHWAQAKCYGWMLLKEKDLKHINIQITYCHVETEEIKTLEQAFDYNELEGFFRDLVEGYAAWARMSLNHKEERDGSIRQLSFPFPQYRKGQRELAAGVYLTIRDRKLLFAQAPTGTGKTISTLFPAVKAMGEGLGEKIFYLTAKTVTRQVAEQTIGIMAEKGLNLKSITLTAKDKVCLCAGADCNPSECAYARGHYDRVNEAVMDILVHETIMTRDTIIKYAEKHQVCPFEFGLDISLWVDCIICDYNYVFDPRAYLRRFFEYGGDYSLLIDEAHNLVERAREMYSVQLSKQDFLKQRKTLKEAAPKAYKELMLINKIFIELRKSFDKKYDTKTIELPGSLHSHVEKFVDAFDQFLANNRGVKIDDALMDLFFSCRTFLSVYKLYDERYVTYATREDSEVKLKLFCVDPSYLLRKACDKSRSAIFFSATLQPLSFYRDMLGGEETDRTMCLSSPFPLENLCLMAAGNVSTRYRDRPESYDSIARYIKAATKRRGNYLVFFPSFEYMRNVYELYRNLWPDDYTIIQETHMDDNDREQFLEGFEDKPNQSMIAFAVMGGIFSEGIDLTGDRLSGAVVVGVGLPQISPERDIIARHFAKLNGLGFEYAYMYPGMNRVLQAAGRVIRTAQDRGFVLLIDDRFLHKRYLSLFPPQWQHYHKVYSPDTVSNILSQFWG
jgi:DNA excision repair protein ERCC-2